MIRYHLLVVLMGKFLYFTCRYQRDDKIKMIVLLGEVGGVEEYEVCEAIQNKTITKPLVAWCIGKKELDF